MQSIWKEKWNLSPVRDNLKFEQILLSLCKSWWNLSLPTYSLIAKVVGAPQMTSQPVSSIFLCSPLPSGLSIPWCCLPTSFSVSLVFFPPFLYPTRWFWSDLMNGRHVHTTSVCVSLRWSGDLCVVQFACWILARISSFVTWSLYGVEHT